MFIDTAGRRLISLVLTSVVACHDLAQKIFTAQVGVTTGTSNVLPQSEPSNYRLEIDALKVWLM